MNTIIIYLLIISSPVYVTMTILYILQIQRRKDIRRLLNRLGEFDPGSDYDEEGIPYWDKWHLKE